MVFVPLTDEEKRILSGEVEEPEEKSPYTGTGGLFGGINISSIPEVKAARDRTESFRREEIDAGAELDPGPDVVSLARNNGIDVTPYEEESFQGAERLNMETPGGGRIVELSPREKAIAKDSQGYSPSTLFLGKRFREAYSFGDPEAYAEDVKRSMVTGIPMHMIDDVETRQAADMWRNWQMNLDGLTKLPPALKNWLSIPGRMEIARDDISTLAQLAEILNVEDYRKNTPRIVRGYRGGEAGSEIARIRWGEIVGSTTEEDLARLPDLEEQAALNDLSEEGWVDRVVGGAGYMAGQRLRQAGGALRGALKYGLAAAGTTALLGQAGPQALLPEEVGTVPAAFLLGSKIGGSLGALKEGLILETGSALDDYLKITDENGEPLPRDLAKMGALLYGVGAAGLEMLQFNKLVKFVPNIGAMMTKQGVATLLKTPTIRSALMSFAKEYAGDLTFELLTEGVQQLWQLGVGEMMKNNENYRRMTEAMSPARAALEGGIGAQAAEFAKFRETTWEEIASSVGSEITSAATTFALALVPGSGTSLINNISAANRAKAMQQKFSSLGDVLQQSKLAKRFGPAVSEVIGELTKNGPIEEIGINARVFSDTLEQAGEDPAAVAKELGISEETLAEARALDGDVWVPTGTYAEKIAATELHGKIAQDIRLGGPEELTAREAETVLAKQQEDLAAAVEEAEAKIAESGEDLAAVNEVKTSLKEQLDTLGLKWLGTQASEAYSTLWANMALQASKRWGMTVKEWTDRINLTVEKDDSGAVRVVGKKKSAAGVSVLPGMKTAQAAEGPVKSEGGVRVSLDRLRPSETIDPETLIRAKENMAAAKRGEIEKRSPLTVWDRGDGTYSIADGNHTYTVLKEAGAADVPVVVEKIRNRNVTDLTSLYDEATKSEPEFKALMADLQGALGGELVMRKEMKTEESVNKKVSAPDYKGDYGLVVDVLGGTLVFDTEEELLAVAEKLKDDGRIVRIKNRWKEPNPDGYRDFLLNVRLPNGYVAELQLHHRAILSAKNVIGHTLYKQFNLLREKGMGEEAGKVREISTFIYEKAQITGQDIPASLKASDLEILRALHHHLPPTSPGTFVSDALDSIIKTLIADPSSSGSHLPSGPISTTKGVSFSDSLKYSNVLTETTSGIQDGSAETGASTAIIPDVTERSKGNVSEVVTGSGTVVQTQFRLAEADELVASNTATFSPNEKYPAELQPRKRDRAASVAQVEGILSNLDPERLGESRMASDGAPIVGSDMVVESGNGRVLALQLMYGRGKATSAAAKSYRSWLKNNAGRFGLLQEEIEGMKAPVLVRERTSDVDRVSFVKEANISSVAAMSASETARSDAEKMSEGLLSIFDPSRDILSTENVPFVKEFLSQVVPSSEWGSITTTTGALSKAGVVRMQNALAARAYGDSQLLERMAESEDDNIRNITKALIQAAPALSVMEDRIARGVLRRGYSLSSFISAAVNQLSVLRERGDTVNDYLAQQTMFADAEIAPEAKRILAFLDKNKRAPARIAGALAGYARLVEGQGNPNQQRLFGEDPLGRMDLWDAAESSAAGTTYEQAGISPSQRLAEDAAQFGRAVDSFLSGDMDKRQPIPVMTTPLALTLAGADLLPTIIYHDTMEKILNDHGLSPETLKTIPAALADPVMVFQSDTREDSIVALLDIRDTKRGSVIVPIALNRIVSSDGAEVNQVSSAYYREKSSGVPQDSWITAQIEKGNLRYINKQKSSAWDTLSGQKLSKGESLSTWMRKQNFSEQSIKTEADLVNLKELNPDLYQDGMSAQHQLDADYQAAVETGDMETAQRMVDEVAQEAGFTVQHVFHGSKRIDRLGNELKPERATSGPMPFFTENPTIAENYSKNKADTSLEIPESYTGWFKVNVGRGKPKTIDQAWLYLSLDKRRELAKKLPHVVRTDENGGIKEEFRLTDDQYGMTDKGQWEFVLREKRGNVLAAAVDIWLDSGELFDQEEHFLEILRLSGLDGVVYDSPWLEQPGVLEAHLAIRNPFDTSTISDDDFAALEAASKGKRGSANVVDEWDKRRFSGREWMELLEQDRKDGTSFAWTSIPDWVSRELHRMGYDGIKDQGGKYAGEGHTVWIPFFPWQAKRADSITRDDKGNVIPLSQRFDTGVKDIRYQGKGTGPQGRISFGDREVLIQLTPKANRSTFLHETGHLFLWDLDNLVKSGRADAETLDHWRTLEGWWKGHAGDLAGWIGKSTRFSEEMRARFSGAEGERIVREALEGRGLEEDVKAVQISAQEYFARGFEQYAMEGKSPSVELRRIFDLFRKWLTRIYTALKGVPDVELSEEVRQVMDRMVASEEAIELSELKQKSDKAASAMLGKGVDDITAREYRQAAEKAAAEAKSRLLRVLMKEMSEEGRKRVEEARRKAEGQILPELLKIPAYRVYDKLVTWLSGTGEKLSSVGLTAEQVMGIPEGMSSAKGGVDLDVAADLLGLESEAELLALLAEAKANPLDDVLKARVDQAVAGVESSMADPEVMEALAEEAILGPERMRLLSLEREILARRIRKITGNTNIHDDRTLAAREAAMRQQAKAMILGKSMRESIAIHKFLAEAKRAAKKAFEAAVAGRLEGSLEAKDREMLYSALYLEGKLIREEAEKQQRYLKKFWAGRQRLKPLIGEENLVQIQALLERYGFQKEDQASKKTMSLHDWLKGANAQLGEDLNEQGAGIPVAEWLWEDEYKGRSKGWKELTVSEFRELHEAVKAIEHYGRSRNKLVAQQLEQDLHKWKDKLQQSVLSVFGKLRPGLMDPNDKGAGPIARFLAAHDRVEFLLRRLDGFADLGTAWQLFFKPVTDAEAIEIRKMKDAKRSVERIFSVYTKEERRAMREKSITTMQLDPATGKPLVLSKENVLVMLLNWGALNNREEVVFGYGFDRTVFNRGQGRIHYADMEQYWDAFRQGEMEVERLFAQILTEKDYDVAQAVWNLNESYWADVAAMVHSLTGVTPEKVEHLPVRGPNGTIYQGGYYHLAFRPESNLQSFVQSEKEGMRALYEPQGMFAMTRSGHTKARHTGPRGARLLRLELGVEVEHLRDVIHDLHFRPVVRDLNRLLNDQQVQQTLIGSIGFESFKQFKPWVHGLANAYRAADNYGEKVVQKIMGNTSAAILGWSMTSALNQVFGWSTVVTSLGVRKTAGAMLHFWTHPQNWKEMKEFAFARSPYLRDRVNSFDRDVKAAIEQITANPVKGKWTALQETFFTVAGLMDMGVSLPAWTAGYEEGIKKFNGNEEKAIDYADWVVRSTQNTGAAKDLASIQRGSPVWKAMTMFYTAFGSIYNQAREQYFRGHGAKDLPRIAGFLLFQFVMPALIGDILNRRGPSGDEDPEEIIEWIFTSILQEMSSTLIIVRDIVNAGTSGFDYRMSPITDAGQSIGRLFVDVGKAGKMVVGGEGPDWEKVAYHAVDVAGTFWGIPSKQILRTTRGLVGMVNDPDWSPIDLLLRKPRK